MNQEYVINEEFMEYMNDRHNQHRVALTDLLTLLRKIGGYMTPEDQIILFRAQELLDKDGK